MRLHKFREPEPYEIEAARELIYRERLVERMGEALSESGLMQRERIAREVIRVDPNEVGQLVTDILESYCKVSDKEAYEKAQEWIEYGDSE